MWIRNIRDGYRESLAWKLIEFAEEKGFWTLQAIMFAENTNKH